MVEKIYAFFGIKSKAVRRRQLVCRLKYVHDMDLAEAFRSKFFDDIIRTKGNIIKARTNVAATVRAYQD